MLASLASPARSQAPPLARRQPISIEGSGHLWQPLTLTFTSFDTAELLHPAGRNPFLDYRLTVFFTHPASGTELAIPGFYAADGDAADTSASGGNRWRVHFAPDRVGQWKWRAEFRRGASIAVDRSLAGSAADARIDGAFGFLEVAPADPSAPGLLAKGRLEHVGEHTWRFAESSEPYLMGGMGGPENFLAYYQFDGTSSSGNSCLSGPDFLHHYQPHAADYGGDAIDQAHTFGPAQKGKNILGAINYLASQGVNALYFITNTHLGDGKDVWPWVTSGDKRHFDVSKLAQWERVFAHLTQRGLMLTFVFEEQENDQIPVAGGGLGHGLTLERKLYYREMVARFAHHPAVFWVIGDESDYFDEVATMESLASEIRALDPYRHPIAFHSKHPCVTPGCTDPQPLIIDQYLPYLAFDGFEATAFQTVPGSYNGTTNTLRASQAAGPKWAHYGIEQSLNSTPVNLDANRARALWGNLMGGGAGVSWFSGNGIQAQYPPGTSFCDYYDLSVEDFRRFTGYFEDTRHALALFHTQLPFTEMAPNNALASVSGATDYVLYRQENETLGIPAVYAVYRGTGSTTGLTLGAGTHTVEWFNPRNGTGPIAGAPLVGPGLVTLVPPLQDPGLDWLAIVRQP
ncbi:MAG: DUF5060 domain-containing protein [Planctomycetes bacterium]|nr:DUF5060 domain-containing protein [Planctomycetota bacterium]